ncbi:MAG: hypothetical protein P8N63_05510 [Pseudomonadales bacterium]|nr:hypothetical protein [Pseudomonadales bacterium]
MFNVLAGQTPAKPVGYGIDLGGCTARRPLSTQSSFKDFDPDRSGFFGIVGQGNSHD